MKRILAENRQSVDRYGTDRLLWVPGQAKTAGRGGPSRIGTSAGRFLLDRADDVLQGLYKFSFETAQGSGHGVMFATEGGRLFGGDSGSCFTGRFHADDGRLSVELFMSRYNRDPKFVPLFAVDNVMLRFEGGQHGEDFRFTGGTDALPGLLFTVGLTPINDVDAPPAGRNGP